MGGVGDDTAVVADSQVGMMLLLVRDLRDDINKCHGLVIVFKRVAVADAFFFCIQLPWRIKFLAEFYDVLLCERTVFC